MGNSIQLKWVSPCVVYYRQGLQSDCISLVIFYSQLLKKVVTVSFSSKII